MPWTEVMSRYKSTLKIYGLRLGKRTTSVRIEPELWEALEEVAFFEGCSVDDIATRAREAFKVGSFASRLRLFMLKYFRERAGEREPRRFSRDGKDRVDQRELGLEMAGKIDPRMAAFLGYWQSLAEGGSLPCVDQFHLDDVAAIGFADHVHVVDVSADDPNQFRCIRLAPVTMVHRIEDGRPMSDLGEGLYAEEIRTQYFQARHRPRPMLQDVVVDAKQEGHLRYQRMVLPWRGQGGIDQLVVGVIRAWA
jgi:predicted DNA-binding ribbon-helix-helix protein